MIDSLRNPLRWPRRHRRIAALVLALAVLGSAIAGILLWRQYHLDTARQALDRFDLDDAQHHLNLCLQVPFRRGAVHLLAARTARRRDAYREALEHLAACEKQQGRTKEFVLEHLLLATQQGELEGMERLLRARARADEAEAVLVLEALAKEYVQRFWWGDVQDCLNELLKRQPEHPQALLMRARLWEDLARNGEPEREADCLRDYEKAIETNPSFEARLGRAGALYRLGRTWDALLEYEQLRSPRESSTEVLLGLARCRYNLGEVDEARRQLDELLERHPDHWNALLERGRLALHAGQPADAEKWLRRAADLAPIRATKPLRSLGQCLEAQHKDEESRRCFDRLHRHEMELLRVDLLALQTHHELTNVIQRSETAADMGRREDGMMSINRLCEQCYEIAAEEMRLGREQEGVAALYLLLKQQPRHKAAHTALADYFERNGQPDRAARHRRLAAKITEIR